jgi:hypothetical protein
MNNPTQRTEEILNSLDGMSRAEASPFLESRIRNRLRTPEPVSYPRWAWQLAVVMAVFVLLNVFTLTRLRTPETPARSGTQAVAGEYSISLPQTY